MFPAEIYYTSCLTVSLEGPFTFRQRSFHFIFRQYTNLSVFWYAFLHCLGSAINRGYYTVARRYGFYLRDSEWVKCLFSSREGKIHIFKPPCNFIFIIDSMQKAVKTSAISSLVSWEYGNWYVYNLFSSKTFASI